MFFDFRFDAKGEGEGVPLFPPYCNIFYSFNYTCTNFRCVYLRRFATLLRCPFEGSRGALVKLKWPRVSIVHF